MWTSIATHSTATTDITSLATSRRKLSRKNCLKCRLWWLVIQFLWNGLSKDRQIYTETHLSGTISHTNLPDMTSPATSGRHLSNLEKAQDNATSDGFESNFSGTAFCLAQPIGGLLVFTIPCRQVNIRLIANLFCRLWSYSERLVSSKILW